MKDVNWKPQNIFEAYNELEYVTNELNQTNDFRAVFPDIYRIVTKKVIDGLNEFYEPEWIIRLAGNFCERYFNALQASLNGQQQSCRAWKIASINYKYPTTNAFLGFNAHINYDLVFGIHETIREFSYHENKDKLFRCKRDHQHVNHMLKASTSEVFNRLIHRYDCQLAKQSRQWIYGPTSYFSLLTLNQWRRKVWNYVNQLLLVKNDAEFQQIALNVEQYSYTMGYLIKGIG
jgi:hypothetical protein